MPQKQGGSMVVLKGKQGTGKGTLHLLMARIYGEAHAIQITQPRQLTGHFNGHLAATLWLFADEAMWAGDREGAGVLKGMATEPHIQIERKGVDSEKVPNRLKVLIASNGDWIVPVSKDDRRFFVLEVSDERKGGVAYFKALREAIAGDEAAAFFHALRARDLAAFDPWQPPATAAHTAQKFHTMSGVARWWFDCLETGSIPGLMSRGWPETVNTADLYRCYVEHSGRGHKEPAHVFGRIIAAHSPGACSTRSGGRRRGGRWAYIMPTLDAARAAFQAAQKIDRLDWDRGGTEGAPPENDLPEMGDDDFAKAKNARS
jgi:hypothetical protein